MHPHARKPGPAGAASKNQSTGAARGCGACRWLGKGRQRRLAAAQPPTQKAGRMGAFAGCPNMSIAYLARKIHTGHAVFTAAVRRGFCAGAAAGVCGGAFLW